MTAKKFVILCMPRTGSNMLVTSLNSHEKIRCHGELFRKNNINLEGALKITNLMEPKYKDESTRHNNPQEFLDAVYELDAASEYIGFKLMLNHHPDFMKRIIEDEEHAKILLHRHNLLAVFSSNKIAKKTGQGVAGRNAEVKTAKIKFKAAVFTRYLNRIGKLYSDTREELHINSQPFLDIEYHSIAFGNGMNVIQNYLGISTVKNLDKMTKKRNPSNILERFTNPEAVIKYLDENNLSGWATEKSQ